MVQPFWVWFQLISVLESILYSEQESFIMYELRPCIGTKSDDWKRRSGSQHLTLVAYLLLKRQGREGRRERERERILPNAIFIPRSIGRSVAAQTPQYPRIFLWTAVALKLAIVFVFYSVTKQCSINVTILFLIYFLIEYLIEASE